MSRPRPPRISVILPVYNRADTVAEAIASVRAQTFRDFELLVVDDGSTDGSAEEIRSAAADDDRISVIAGNRGGVSAARNRGLHAATGQIVTYLDADNQWRPRFLEVVDGTLRGRHRSSCYAALAIHTLDADGRETSEAILDNAFDGETIVFGNQIDLNTFAHTIDLYEDLGGFDESMTRLVDWHLILRYTRVAPPIRIRDVLADYRNAPDANRISVCEDYAPNRLRVAIDIRLALVPQIVCFGRAPKIVDSALRRTGLEVIDAEKTEELDARLTGNPLVVWTWSEWDEDLQRLDRVSRIVRARAGLSLYLIPEQSTARSVERLYRRFDLVGLRSADDVRAFAKRVAVHQNPTTPTNTLLTFDGEPSGSVTGAIALATNRRHPPARTTFLMADHPQLVRLAGAVRRRDFEVLATTDQRADVVILGPEDPPIRPNEAAGAVGRWVDDEHAAVDALATVDFVVTTESAAAELQGRYPGLRVWGMPSDPTRAAQSILVRAGELLRADRPDARPVFLRPRVLYVHGQRDANTTRKRCFEIMRVVEGAFEVHAIPYEDFTPTAVVGRDIVVFQRWAADSVEHVSQAFAAIARFRGLGKRFVYEIDDYIFHFGNGLPIEFMRACDETFVSTPYLAELARRHTPNVTVLRNGIDGVRFHGARSRPLSTQHRHILVASTDGLGFDDLDELVRRVDAPDLTWHFVSAIREPTPRAGVEFHHVMTIDRLFALMKACDLVVNLSRPSDRVRVAITGHDGEDLTDFVRAKSEVKYQYAALAGVPFVTACGSDIYRDVVRNGDNGFLVETTDEMPGVIARLLDDPETRRAVAERAHQDVLEHHTSLARRDEYRRAILDVARPNDDVLTELRPDLWGEADQPVDVPTFLKRQVASYWSASIDRSTEPAPEPTAAEALQILRERIRREAKSVARHPTELRRTLRRVLRLVRK